MNLNRALPALLVASILAVSNLTGCADKPSGAPKGPQIPAPPAPPPAAPARVNTPIDLDLRRDAQSELTRASYSDDPVLRANAVEAIQKGLSVGGGDRIIAALDDASPLVQFAGAMGCGELRLIDARPRLQLLAIPPDQLSSNPANPLGRQHAAMAQIGIRYALHRLGDSSRSHDLEIFAQDADPRIRANVVLVLGLLGEKSAMKILHSLQRDLDPAVRLQVVEARYRLGDEEALQELVVGTVSKFPDDQIISLLALGSRHDDRVARLLAGKLTSDYPEVSLAAARALGMVDSDLGMGVALKNAGSREPRQRGMAALALGEIGRSDAQSALSRLLKDSDANVRLAAATAILQLKPAS